MKSTDKVRPGRLMLASGSDHTGCQNGHKDSRAGCQNRHAHSRTGGQDCAAGSGADLAYHRIDWHQSGGAGGGHTQIFITGCTMNDRTERRTMQRYRSRQAGSYCAAGTANHRRHTDTNIQSRPQSRLSTNQATGEIDMQTIMLTPPPPPPNGRVYLMPAALRCIPVAGQVPLSLLAG